MSTSPAPNRPKPAATRSPNRRLPIIVIIAAAVVGAAVFAVATGGKKSTAGEVNPVTVIGTPLPALPKDTTAADPAADPAVGLRPPELSGKRFNGDALTIAPGGRAKLVLFIAHWCPHCQREVPRIVTWISSGQKPASLDVLAVSTDVDPAGGNYPPSKWLARENFTVDTMTDDANRSALKAWGQGGFPFVVLVKADGTVAARTSGEMEIADLDAWVRKGLGIT